MGRRGASLTSVRLDEQLVDGAETVPTNQMSNTSKSMVSAKRGLLILCPSSCLLAFAAAQESARLNAWTAAVVQWRKSCIFGRLRKAEQAKTHDCGRVRAANHQTCTDLLDTLGRISSFSTRELR